MKQLRVLSASLAAALCLLAFAGAGSAAAEQFHFSAASAAVVGQQISGFNKISLTGQSIECENAAQEGTGPAGKTSESLTVTPTFGFCKAFGFISPAISTNGCSFTYDANTVSGKGSFDIKGCSAGGITVQVNVQFIAKCRVVFKEQEGINNVTYTSHLPKDALTVQLESNNLHAEVTESVGLCPLTKGTHANATYTGTMEFVADKGGTEIWWE